MQASLGEMLIKKNQSFSVVSQFQVFKQRQCNTKVQSVFVLTLPFCTVFNMHFCTKFGSGKWQFHGSITEQATDTG